MARLERLTERVLEIEEHEEVVLGNVTEQLDDVLQEIRELSDEMDSHERLQEQDGTSSIHYNIFAENMRRL